MAITSKKINLAQLDKELGNKGLVGDFTDPNNKIISPADNSDISERELELAIDKHNAIDEIAIKLASRQAVLDRLGLTEEEARLLLG